MELFISWSGKRSRAIAESLREWLEMLFNEKVQPWMSAKDLGSGEWRKELEHHLSKTHAGIVCVTPENFNPSWMLYEVGFLSNSVKGAFVVPYLIDITMKDLKGPLEQFQVRSATQEDTRKLVEVINEALGDERIDTGVLGKRFETLWPELEKRIRRLGTPEVAIDVENERRVTLRQAVARIGLVDIENREEALELQLPPEKFYRKATREIAMTGVSLYRTFEAQLMVDIFREALGKGEKLYFMLLHPTAPDVKRWSKFVNADVPHDIDAVIRIIKKNKFHKNPNFQIKFMQRMPPFQAVMLDGDVAAPEASTPQDVDGQIRAQPLSQYVTSHHGIILQFRKTISDIDSPAGGFDYFAQDLRKQWRFHGKAYPDLFA